MRTNPALLVLALLLSSVVLAAGHPNDVLVAVEPATQSLTRAKQARLVDFIEWVFKAPLTNAQRAHLEALVLEGWRDAGEREGLQGWLEGADETDKFPPEQRPLVREKLLEAFLPAIREEAKKDANAKWLIGLYDAANKPLVFGKPALTRQAVEATVEMLSFSLCKAHGLDLKPTKADHDEAVKNMVAAWPKMSAQQKADVVSAPMKWADLRAAWDAASAADREEVAAGWREAFPMPEQKASPFSTTPGQRKAMKVLKEADAYLARDPSQWTTDELRRLAGSLRAVAGQLRGEAGMAALAEQVAGVEAGLNKVAQDRQNAAAQAQARAEASRAQQSSSGRTNAAGAMYLMQAHQNQMRFMEQMRQSQFNMIQNLGNNPYRYGP